MNNEFNEVSCVTCVKLRTLNVKILYALGSKMDAQHETFRADSTNYDATTGEKRRTPTWHNTFKIPLSER